MSGPLRDIALQIFRAAVEAVSPERVIRRRVHLDGHTLRVGDWQRSLSDYNRVVVVGAGKASLAMAAALESVLGGEIDAGLVLCPYGLGGRLDRVRTLEAGHPVPDESGVAGTREIVSLLGPAGPRDLVFCLLSGGGSSLLCAPVEGLRLEDKRRVTNLLLRSGADIREVNSVRKHLSRVKGGQLARAAGEATLVSLIISDVVGDPLDSIASGPTTPDPTTYADAIAVLECRGIWFETPPSIRHHLRAGARGEAPETPKPGDPLFEKVTNLVVANNELALQTAGGEAERLGFTPLILSSRIRGDTREAASFHAAIAEEAVRHGRPVLPPACILSGGETTVVVRGDGKGGRNQEFALAWALAVDGVTGLTLLSAGTDGIDGPTEAAGAFATGDTIERARRKGLCAADFLARNDSFSFFDLLGDLLVTGPTGTNVMDLRVLLVAPGE